jgi:hypothetical protein
MTPVMIIREAQADGVKLSLSPQGKIIVAGNSMAVNRWLALLRQHKAEIVEVLKAGTGDRAATSRGWLIHLLDGDALQVICVPDMTEATILAAYPDAVAAAPFMPSVREPSNPMSAFEESAIREWLALIDETDPATIAFVLHECQRDDDARNYFLWRAEAALFNSPFISDDLGEKEVPCQQ